MMGESNAGLMLQVNCKDSLSDCPLPTIWGMLPN